MKEEEQRLIAALRDLTDEQTRNREAELERREEERLERERAEEARKQTDITAITDLLENKFQKSDDLCTRKMSRCTEMCRRSSWMRSSARWRMRRVSRAL